MPLFEEAKTNPSLLIRLNANYLNLWDAILAGQNRFISKDEAISLIEAFAQRIESCEQIFCSVEKETRVLAKLQEFLPQIQILPWQGEQKHIEFLLQKTEHLALARGIYPLLDIPSSQTLYLMHEEYLADFSYIEDMPEGSYLYFFSQLLLESPAYQELKDSFPENASLSDYIRSHLNEFHVEIHWEEPDLRLLRLDLTCSTIRSLVKVKKLLPHVAPREPLMPQLEHHFEKTPSLLFFWPSYLEIEIYSGCSYACLFCPRQYTKQETKIMSLDILEKILSFCQKGPQDTTICVGGMGEPLEHPDSPLFLQKILEAEGVRELILETNGLHLDRIYHLLEHPKIAKFKVIVNLSSLKNYQKLHGVNLEIQENALSKLKNWNQKIKEKNLEPFKITYMQVLKITDNEDEVDELYAFCQEEGMQFLLQKYNRYIELMPERRVSDMTPLERFFCWHLRRDMYIRADGTVSFCKQDITNQNPRGNIKEEEIESIWQRQLKDFEDNYQKRLALTPNCARCDEYFTFNA
ncbi:MAG: spiro-SPASM protein [Leptospiraceae bacterium]|nr:spiro-SPASM protein [Leptospiraceae bacterium]MDW8305766.1 spiro-SPASM protein [Leptospiraceae bacterium]